MKNMAGPRTPCSGSAVWAQTRHGGKVSGVAWWPQLAVVSLVCFLLADPAGLC
jgi:hypothetical protein